nr:hypothetical protein [Candidatus Gracilibacteria bacterium]
MESQGNTPSTLGIGNYKIGSLSFDNLERIVGLSERYLESSEIIKSAKYKELIRDRIHELLYGENSKTLLSLFVDEEDIEKVRIASTGVESEHWVPTGTNGTPGSTTHISIITDDEKLAKKYHDRSIVIFGKGIKDMSEIGGKTEVSFDYSEKVWINNRKSDLSKEQLNEIKRKLEILISIFGELNFLINSVRIWGNSNYQNLNKLNQISNEPYESMKDLHSRRY